MKSRLVLLLLAAHAGAALAQYKCTGANGAVTFQQTPCFGARAEEKLVVIPNGHPPPAPAIGASSASAVRTTPIVEHKPAPAPAPASAPVAKVETSADKRMLANYERQHRREPFEQALRDAQDDKAKRATQRAQAIAAAQRHFGDDPTNAAALKDAVTAINGRYNALGGIDDSKVRSAQAALDDWDHAQAKAASAP